MTTELLLWYDDVWHIDIFLLRKHKWNEQTKTWDFIPCSNMFEVRVGDETVASTNDAMIAFEYVRCMLEVK